jgi:hypothetical protein
MAMKYRYVSKNGKYKIRWRPMRGVHGRIQTPERSL